MYLGASESVYLLVETRQNQLMNFPAAVGVSEISDIQTVVIYAKLSVQFQLED